MRPKGQLFDLKRFRDDNKVTQKAIAEAVNRPQSFLSAIEHGRRSAPPAFLDDLARIYNVDNISDYISDREDFDAPSIEDVHNSIINSSTGSLLVTGINGAFTAQDLLKILSKQDKTVDLVLKETEVQPKKEEASTVANLVHLLAAAEERYKEAEKKIRELEAQVNDLQRKLSKLK